jgi:hypothetical protein
MAKRTPGPGSTILLAVPFLLLWSMTASAFDPTTDHVCVANCASPSPSPSPSRGTAPAQGMGPMQQIGLGAAAALGNAIGRSLSGSHRPVDVPNNGQNESARQYLEQWENGNSGVAASSTPAPDRGGLTVGGLTSVNAPQPQPARPGTDDGKSPNTTLQVINQTPSYVTVSVDGSYGCNTAGGTTCVIPVLKGHHILRAVRTDTGASFNQSVEIASGGLVWPLSGN